ncbi:hypothetical protein ElyMa_002378700 [Elysia marginata]|uniref:Uncharacterized protein n=1 Tax=Elysia marginata TaxID=1093978 RepID=A0AAV4GCK7_9GAST|nr:hypothetical protein ElyMa_002378700 [Elysia marginata]
MFGCMFAYNLWERLARCPGSLDASSGGSLSGAVCSWSRLGNQIGLVVSQSSAWGGNLGERLGGNKLGYQAPGTRDAKVKPCHVGPV